MVENMIFMRLVDLKYCTYNVRYNATGPSGIYCCVIATNAVHSDSNPSVGEAVYVGLYHSGGVC